MQLFGARVVVLADRGGHLDWLVRERGWYPSSGTSLEPVGTPYGVEGYEDHRLRGSTSSSAGAFPDRMVVPTSGGDAIYGPWKGFRELQPSRRRGRLAADGGGAGGRLRSDRSRLARGRHGRARASGPADRSRYRSPTRPAARPRSGRSSSPAARRRRCRTRRSSTRCDGWRGRGSRVEPSSATAVAGALALAARGELGPDEDVVCVLTGAGVKWPDALVEDAHAAGARRTRARRRSARGSTRWTAARARRDRPDLTPRNRLRQSAFR
mgnify:CR=1 FL=1